MAARDRRSDVGRLFWGPIPQTRPAAAFLCNVVVWNDKYLGPCANPTACRGSMVISEALAAVTQHAHTLRFGKCVGEGCISLLLTAIPRGGRDSAANDSNARIFGQLEFEFSLDTWRMDAQRDRRKGIEKARRMAMLFPQCAEDSFKERLDAKRAGFHGEAGVPKHNLHGHGEGQTSSDATRHLQQDAGASCGTEPWAADRILEGGRNLGPGGPHPEDQPQEFEGAVVQVCPSHRRQGEPHDHMLVLGTLLEKAVCSFVGRSRAPWMEAGFAGVAAHPQTRKCGRRGSQTLQKAEGTENLSKICTALTPLLIYVPPRPGVPHLPLRHDHSFWLRLSFVVLFAQRQMDGCRCDMSYYASYRPCKSLLDSRMRVGTIV